MMFNNGPKYSQGSALIVVVVAILIFSLLAAAIVPMVGSSSQQTAVGLMAEKAYLMAESGFRFAAAKYLHALPNGGNEALESLEGDYTLADGNSQYQLQIFSYFCETRGEIANGDTSFQAHFPGTIPDDINMNNGLKLLIGEELKPEHIYAINGTAVVGGHEADSRVISVTPPISPSSNGYPDGTQIYPLAYPDDTRTPTLSNGGNLAYQSGEAAMFPLRNGRIRISDRFLTYRFNDRTNAQFIDVRDPDDETMSAFTVNAGDPILLTPFVRVNATGSYGSGAMQARRQVVYYAPLPLSESTTKSVEVTERFNSKEDWRDIQGSTTIGQVGGNNALKVEATQTMGADKGSLTVFNPTSATALTTDFDDAQRGTRGYLSYDAQIKVGFESLPIPDSGYYPAPPTPSAFAAGLSFRLSNADSGIFKANTYGLSLMRGNSATADGILDAILPIADQRAIVLWLQTGNGALRTWLAYKAIPVHDALPLQDFNADDGGWTPDNSMWQYLPISPDGGTPAWFADLNAASGTSGLIESQPIEIPADYPETILTFRSWLQSNSIDIAQIRILSGGVIANSQFFQGTNTPSWKTETISLSEFAGQTVILQFYFRRRGIMDPALLGWYIDDVQIQCQWPIQNATLEVRLREAMVVRFKNGFPRIKAGSRLYGQDRNTVATVMATPLVTEGDWTESNPAKGVLLLNRPSVLTADTAFNENEILMVVGGSGRAQVDGYDDTNDRKANVIQVFYAAETAGGSGGNTNPLDCNTAAYPRLESAETPAWPPELDDDGNWTTETGNLTSDQDFFRLIVWDAVNEADVSGLRSIPFITHRQGLIQRAFIQSHHAELQTPAFPTSLSSAEIGLHTFGDGAENVYFDDFGLLMDVAQFYAIPNPLQE